MAEKTQPTPSEPSHKSHSLVARLVAAKGFSMIGSNIGLLGLPADANIVLKGQNLSLGQKIKATFNGTLLSEAVKQAESLAEKEKNPKSMVTKLKVGVKIVKFYTILTVIGTIAGGVLGWVRGGRIEHASDIIKHPWRSTKIILGFDKPPEKTKVESETVASSMSSSEPDTDTKWQDKFSQKDKDSASVRPRGAYTEAATREEPSTQAMSV